VRNTWIICLEVRDNQPKGWLIPGKPTGTSVLEGKGAIRHEMSPRPIS